MNGPREGQADRARRLVPPRRWPRRLLVGVNVVTVMSLVAIGAVYGYARYRLDQIKTISNLPFNTGGPGASADGTMNILLVGDNSRVGLDPAEAAKFGTPDQAGGSHSDVTMILHLDTKTGGAALLSIPRDLFVPLPPRNIAGAVGKIDSALNGTNYQYSDGAAQLITTIQNDLGIPINHYIQINFDGFQRTVDALGGVNMYFPTQLYDIDAALRIYHSGCLHLNGSTALAVVRSRHLKYLTATGDPSAPAGWPQEQQSDLARIRRDHTFLQVLAATVTAQGVTTDLGKLNNIVGALISQVTIDEGLKSLLIPLVKSFRRINLATVPQMTLPVTVLPDAQYRYGGGAYGQVDFPVEPLDHQVIAQWAGRPLPKVDPSSITVQVRNISNVAHQAATAVAALSSLGFKAANAGSGTPPASTVETMVRYHPGPDGLAQAETLLQSLSGAVMMQSDPRVDAGTVTVDTGTSLAVASANPVALTPTSPPSGRSSGASTSTAASSGHQPVSSATDQPAAWDPVACPPGQPVVGA